MQSWEYRNDATPNNNTTFVVWKKQILTVTYKEFHIPNKEGKVKHSWPPFVCWNIKYQEVRVSPVSRFQRVIWGICS